MKKIKSTKKPKIQKITRENTHEQKLYEELLTIQSDFERFINSFSDKPGVEMSTIENILLHLQHMHIMIANINISIKEIEEKIKK